MAKIIILRKDGKTNVYIDGVKVNGILAMKLESASSAVPVLHLDIHATEIMADIDKADVNIDKRAGESN